MIVVMEKSASTEDVNQVQERIRDLGYKPHNVRFESHEFIGISRTEKPEVQPVQKLPGVVEVLDGSSQQKLALRESKQTDTLVRVGDVVFGDGNAVLIAGPCAVESEQQLMDIALRVRDSGAQILRGGAFKPRTSPYSFQGLGERGLEFLAEARERTGLPVVTEAIDNEAARLVAQYADMIQIGTRNMQNFSLLEEVGKLGKPVMLKRGMSATLKETLLSAEYIMSNGTSDVVICERGIRTFNDHSRNTLDLGFIPAMKSESHLPVIVDPSHASGRRDSILPMAYAALSAGADGIMVDVHTDPEHAKVDGLQAIVPEEFEEMMTNLRKIAEALGRKIGTY